MWLQFLLLIALVSIDTLLLANTLMVKIKVLFPFEVISETKYL